MRRHVSLAKLRMARSYPDVTLLAGVVPQDVLQAMRTASARLTELGIRHALAGGLAVGAYGYPRFSKDVDFLVGEEAFERHAGGIVSVAPGVPIQVGKVAIDQILPKEGETHLLEAIGHAVDGGGVPILPIEALIYMKLDSPRRKDEADVVELVKAGADAGLVREYLKLYGRGLLEKFDRLAAEAEAE